MKLQTWTILFMGIFFCFFAVYYTKTSVGDKVTQVSSTYKQSTLYAAQDTAQKTAVENGITGYNTKNRFYDTPQKRENAVASVISIYAANYNIKTDAADKLSDFIPLICMVDYDGFYVNYTGKVKDNTGSDAIKRVTSTENIWAYSKEGDNRFSTRFFLGNNVEVADKTTGIITTGKYKEVYQKIEAAVGADKTLQPSRIADIMKNVDFLNDETLFNQTKNNLIVSSIESTLQYYINENNIMIDKNAVAYNVSLAYAYGEDWSRVINSPTVYVFLQGLQNSNMIGDYDIYALSAGEVKKNDAYFIEDRTVKPVSGPEYKIKYYHKIGSADAKFVLDSNPGMEIGKIYASKEDAAKAGAYPCPICVE